MKTQSISSTPAFSGNKFVIANAGKNKSVQFLYNKVCDLATKNEVHTNFKTDKIEISTLSETQKNNITKGLKKMGAEFSIDGEKYQSRFSKFTEKVLDFLASV